MKAVGYPKNPSGKRKTRPKAAVCKAFLFDPQPNVWGWNSKYRETLVFKRIFTSPKPAWEAGELLAGCFFSAERCILPRSGGTVSGYGSINCAKKSISFINAGKGNNDEKQIVVFILWPMVHGHSQLLAKSPEAMMNFGMRSTWWDRSFLICHITNFVVDVVALGGAKARTFQSLFCPSLRL